MVADEIESLIRRADQADRGATDQLFAVLYDELHRLAEHTLRRAGSSLTLGTTTLLHEAYLNIAGRENIAFAERSRFLAYASRAMRGLIIDYAPPPRQEARPPVRDHSRRGGVVRAANAERRGVGATR